MCFQFLRLAACSENPEDVKGSERRKNNEGNRQLKMRICDYSQNRATTLWGLLFSNEILEAAQNGLQDNAPIDMIFPVITDCLCNRLVFDGFQ